MNIYGREKEKAKNLLLCVNHSLKDTVKTDFDTVSLNSDTVNLETDTVFDLIKQNITK